MASIGPYDIERELGRGGMGRVLLVRHRATGAPRALKVLEGAYDPESVARFRREAATLARLDSAGVVPIHDSGVEGGRLWFAMSVMPGGSLRDALRARGTIPWREAVVLATKLARTLARAHDLGLVHRDLKPDNVLFDEQGEPRIADFGCVRDLGAETRLTDTGVTFGTPVYMAPEQLDARPVDGRADVFSLGCILYEMVTGVRPYDGRNLAEIGARALRGDRQPIGTRAAVPASLEMLVARALAPRAEDRLDARAFVAVLDTVKDSEKPASRVRPAGVAIAVVACVAVGLGVAVLARRGPERAPQPAEKASSIAALVSDVERATAFDKRLADALDAAVAAAPAPAVDLHAARARAERRWGKPLHADDLVALARTPDAEGLAMAALSKGLVPDDGVAGLVDAGPTLEDPGLAAVAAIAALRRGVLPDAAWLDRARGRSSWLNGVSEAIHLVAALVESLPPPTSEASFSPDLEKVSDAVRKLERQLAPLKAKDEGVVRTTIVRPMTAALRRFAVAPGIVSLRILIPYLVQTGMSGIVGDAYLEDVIAVVLADSGDGPAIVARLEDTEALKRLESEDALLAMSFLVRASALHCYRAAQTEAVDRAVELRPSEALADRGCALGEALLRAPARPADMPCVVARLAQLLATRVTAIANGPRSPEEIERARRLFDRQTELLRALEGVNEEWVVPAVMDAAVIRAQLRRDLSLGDDAAVIGGRREHYAETWVTLALSAEQRRDVHLVEAFVAIASRATWQNENPELRADLVALRKWVEDQRAR